MPLAAVNNDGCVDPRSNDGRHRVIEDSDMESSRQLTWLGDLFYCGAVQFTVWETAVVVESHIHLQVSERGRLL